MKTTNIISASIFIFTLGAFLLSSSCKKPDSAAAPVGMGHLYFHLHTDIQSTEVDSGIAFPDVNGRLFKLTYAQFFISSVSIYKWENSNQAGSPYTLPSTTGMLKYIENENYYMADVPAGNYGSVSYNIGLTPAENSMACSLLYSQFNSSVNGLPPANAPMWDAVHGYTVLYVQGLADTNKLPYKTAADSLCNFPFSYRIYSGVNAAYFHVQLPVQQFTILPGQQSFIHQILDYGSLFQGNRFVSSATSNSTDTAGLRSVNQLLSRIPCNFIRYESHTVNP